MLAQWWGELFGAKRGVALWHCKGRPSRKSRWTAEDLGNRAVAFAHSVEGSEDG